jgi:hypothetical protein
MMANSLVVFICTSPNKWYTDGFGDGYASSGGLQTFSVQATSRHMPAGAKEARSRSRA